MMMDNTQTTSNTPVCCGAAMTWDFDCWWCFECMTATPYSRCARASGRMASLS